MSGLLTVAGYAALAPTSTIVSPLLDGYLMAAQAITEQLTGYRFGCEVTGVINMVGLTYRLDIGYPIGNPGDKVILIGNGIPSTTPFTITDSGQNWITVDSLFPINPVKALPVCEFIGAPMSGFVYVSPMPVFSVLSVKTRTSAEQLWSDSDITTLSAASYEIFRSSNGVQQGIQLRTSAVPRGYEGGPGLVKRMPMVPRDSVRVEYAAGYYAAVPADLQMAQVELVGTLARSGSDGGVFASESYDYYSYQTLTFEQAASIPSSALATFRRYSRR